MLITFGVAGAASAQIFTGVYDFADTQYADDFTDVRRGSQINGGFDLGGTGETALNFTGQAGPAGDTWLTKWTPGGATGVLNGRCEILTAANVLIHPFNNRKGAGVVALLNDTNPGDKGLAFTLYDNGNTDAIQLAIIDPFTGKLVPLQTARLIAPVNENAWYALVMNVRVDLAYNGHSLLVQAYVFRYEDPTDANSDPSPIGYLSYSTVFTTSLEELGLQPAGQVGIMASAISAVVDSSVTTWGAIEGNEGPCFE
jgi:hypothetical protein